MGQKVDHQLVREVVGHGYGPVYIRYRSSSQKNEAEECKRLQAILLTYSNAKFTV